MRSTQQSNVKPKQPMQNTLTDFEEIEDTARNERSKVTYEILGSIKASLFRAKTDDNDESGKPSVH